MSTHNQELKRLRVRMEGKREEKSVPKVIGSDSELGGKVAEVVMI